MAYYWDYYTDSTTSTGTWYNPTIWYTGTETITSSGLNDSTATTSFTGSGYYYYYVVEVRRYLVSVPEHWGDPEIAGFTRLVNDETKTGFKVGMVIKGEIRITDPTIEKRTMADFLPLLKSYASAKDRELIDKFFKQVPAEKPAS